MLVFGGVYLGCGPLTVTVVNEGLVLDSLLLLLCHSQTIPSIVHHSSAFYVIFYVRYFFLHFYTLHSIPTRSFPHGIFNGTLKLPKKLDDFCWVKNGLVVPPSLSTSLALRCNLCCCCYFPRFSASWRTSTNVFWRGGVHPAGDEKLEIRC